MLFPYPVSFDEAVKSRAVRAMLPTSLSSADLAKIKPELLERAVFSARVPYVSHLQTLDGVIGSIIDPPMIKGEDGKPHVAPGEGINEARAREILRQSLADLGYKAAEGEEGTIKDLASEARIRLQVQMGTDFARGYGQWRVGMDDDVLNEFPAQRLLPSIADHPRSTAFWNSRWAEAGLPILPGNDLVALKTDPGWARLSIFGLPYPPFDWGSTRDLEDVDRDEAESLGLVDPATRLQGQRRPFDDGLSATLPGIGAGAAGLQQAILDAMPGFRLVNNILSKVLS